MIKNLEEQIISTCRFCNPPEKERILCETENFYVMLSLGPIVEGYCLLVSKHHYACCAAIPSEIRGEFKELYRNVKSILTTEYGTCLSYEHGRAGACLIPLEGSKHCYHAHMHFVPVSTKLNEAIQKDFDPENLENLDSFFEIYSKNHSEPYLFADDNRRMSLYFIDQPLRRQYLRYKTAILIGKDHLCDWVNHQGWDLINSALQVLPKHFKILQ